jgi:hypothetical protein
MVADFRDTSERGEPKILLVKVSKNGPDGTKKEPGLKRGYSIVKRTLKPDSYLCRTRYRKVPAYSFRVGLEVATIILFFRNTWNRDATVKWVFW